MFMETDIVAVDRGFQARDHFNGTFTLVGLLLTSMFLFVAEERTWLLLTEDSFRC
jgi:hypothetical protein